MGAIDETRAIDMSRCNLCLECRVSCPRQVIRFNLSRPVQGPAAAGLTRRQFMGAAVTGLVLPQVREVGGLARWSYPSLIRPPGALAEREFLGRCVRCGECLQVCIGNGLQATLLQGGLDALFTPMLAARSGYCEYNCTLCGQVCPTGAIARLTVEEKRAVKIGNAWFDLNRCLPYARGVPCMVCEEHCPTVEKAIRFREVETVNSSGEMVMVKQPYVVDELCIGCGICEFKCPLPGQAGIRLVSDGEHRHPEKRLPGPHDFYGG